MQKTSPTQNTIPQTQARMPLSMKLFLYLLPFALPVLLLTSTMIYTGESMPLTLVIQHQMSDQPVLYRPQYGNRDLWFKTLSIEARQPEVLVVGSSRVLQMRSGLLTEAPEVFYNAGAPAWTLEQIATLLFDLDADALPQVLIFGLDHPWFNDAYVGDTFEPIVNDFSHLFDVNRSVMQEAISGTFNFDMGQMMARREPENGGMALGLRAIRDGHGFRNDGSEQYGDFLVAGWLWQPRERERHTEWMRTGEDMYVFGDSVSEEGIAQLIAILDFAQEHDIQVIGFMPPFVPSLYQEMMARGNHTYMTALVERLETLFTEYDFAFFDFSDSQGLGTSADFFDGWHGSERVYLRLFSRMVEDQPEILGPYTDAEMLRQIDANVTDTWCVFGP